MIHRTLRFLRRLVLAVVALFVLALVAGLAWWGTHRDQARGWRQAATVAAQVGEVDAATRVLGSIDDEPGRSRVTHPGGLPATTIAPTGGGPHPTLVLLVPNDTTDAELDDIVRVQRAFAHAGMAAWALRTPDPGRALGDDTHIEALEHALEAIRQAHGTKGRRISIAASGALASQALVASTVPPLRGHVRAVLAVQPVADVQGLVRLAVTGRARDAHGTDHPHPAARTLRRVAGRAIVEALRNGPGDRSVLEDRLLDSVAASDDPISTLGLTPPALLTPDLARARDVLAADTPVDFDVAWALLPEDLRAKADERSPLFVAPRIRARVLLAVPNDDSRYPAGDAGRLARAIGGARLIRTSLLDPGAGPGDASGQELRDALSISAWWLQRAGT